MSNGQLKGEKEPRLLSIKPAQNPKTFTSESNSSSYVADKITQVYKNK